MNTAQKNGHASDDEEAREDVKKCRVDAWTIIAAVRGGAAKMRQRPWDRRLGLGLICRGDRPDCHLWVRLETTI